MPTIAISYRRSDSSAIAGRICDRLTAHYGEHSVFMDIDNIPFGIDFRAHIQETLQRTDVLVAIVGVNWLGANAAGEARMQEKSDPVRAEIATAIERKTPIIPVLVDGAKMPNGTDLPPDLGNFAYLNAAEVATGRDFRSHMDRLINAIDRTMTAEPGMQAPRQRSGATLADIADIKQAPQQNRLTDTLRYFVVPLVLLLVAHHVIVNALDLDTAYLQIVSAAIPFSAGFVFFWVTGRGAGPACGSAIALGIVGVVGMTVSQSLNSGDPIMPQTRYEWWDNINFATIIALSYLAGHTLARALRVALSRKFLRS